LPERPHAFVSKARSLSLVTRKRGRPPGIKPRSDDLDILWQVYIWMTWPQYRTRSFDQLARWAAMSRQAPAADRTTQPNRLKRLHAAVTVAPAEFGFPNWVSRLPVKGRRVPQPKRSGAKGAFIRRAARDLQAEAERIGRELKSQTRPSKD
jgi:hypothetical protein